LWIDWGDAASQAPRLLADYLKALYAHPSLAKGQPQAEAAWLDWQLDHAVLRLAVALQRAMGHPVPPASHLDADRLPPGRVVIPVWDVELGTQAGRAAFELLALGLTVGGRPDVAGGGPTASAILDNLFAAAAPINYSESTIRLIEAAERRGIPWTRLIPGTGLLMLGHGARQTRLFHSYTPATSFIATQISTHKDVAARLLRRQGLPVPANQRVDSVEAALRAAAAIGFPVVVKPTSTDYGTAVSLDVRDEADLRRAYAEAARHGAVLVEQQIAGEHTRLLVLHGRFVSAVRMDPAQVLGDGRRTVSALIVATNADRTADLSSSFKKIAVDDEARLLLGRQGLALDSIPADGRKVILRHTSNASRGGTVRNATARVHPDNARLAERAAAVVGLDVAGVDLITPDIERSFRDVGGAICEINPTPGLYMREARFVIEDAFLDGLFAPGDRGRVPILCLLADDDVAAAALMSEIGARLGARIAGVALVQPGSVRIGDWLVTDRPGSLHEAARLVLADPATRAAVIHLTHRAIAEDGLPFDACDLALLAPFPALRPEGDGEALERHRAAALLRAWAGEHDDLADRGRLLGRVERVAFSNPGHEH
jgi:cyanophycin synthetase